MEPTAEIRPSMGLFPSAKLFNQTLRQNGFLSGELQRARSPFTLSRILPSRRYLARQSEPLRFDVAE